MKLLLSVFVLCAILSQGLESFAQLENIDLNKYKLTDFKYKQLSTILNQNNSSYQSKNSSSNTSDNYNNSSGTFAFNSSKYSRNFKAYNSVSFGIQRNSNKSDDSRNNYKSSSIYNYANLDVTSNNQFYFSNNYFYAINFVGYLRPNQNIQESHSDYSDYEYQYNNFDLKSKVSFQFGKGRIENVTDARLAIYILDNLYKQGRISRIPKEDEVFEFADFITKTLNHRVIDTRIKRIKEYVAVDSFLVSKGLASKSDGLYFGLLNDNWNYARSQDWQTGGNWYVGLSPTLLYKNNYFKNNFYGFDLKEKGKSTGLGVELVSGFSSSRIKGLKRIEGFYMNGSYSIFKFDTIGSYTNNLINNYQVLQAKAGYWFSFIPNTRTSISTSLSIEAQKYLNESLKDQINLYPTCSGSCNYYFSEKLRFSFSSSIYYSFSKELNPDFTTKGLNFNFGATLNYFFF